MLKKTHFWKFTTAVKSVKPAGSSVRPAESAAPVSVEPKYLAEPSPLDDALGDDRAALEWAEKHDPETRALLDAKPIA